MILEKKESFVITIDGPAGSGKSTVSAVLARRMKLPFLTTGALYRGLAVLCIEKKVDFSDPQKVADLASYPKFLVTADPSGTQVHIDGLNVTDRLNTLQVAKLASQVSAFPQVRLQLLGAQRAFNKYPGLVAEGRDCGTVVFPEAQVKIFLSANLEKRALRRSSEDMSASYGEHAVNLSKRDAADTQRKAAPLTRAPDAVEIDTSDLSVDEVVDKIEAIVTKKLAELEKGS